MDKIWKQWHIKGGKVKGKENANNDKETTLAKVDDKVKEKGKGSQKGKDNKARRKRLKHAIIVE